MEVKIVLGHAFGDEGKGVTVQWLCKKAIEEGKKPLVIRFSGGPQAAHTITHNGVEHICSSFGSGVLLGVPTWYTDDVYIDPICLKKEYDVLKSKGIEPKLAYNYNRLFTPYGYNRLITPYDVLAGRSDQKVLSDGTCGKGLYSTFKRANSGITACTSVGLLSEAAQYHKLERNAEYDKMFIEAYDWMMTTLDFHNVHLSGFDVLIYEGTQGLLLDADNGFYPHVTPSRVGLNGIRFAHHLRDAELYLVTRTYTTRHGNGYEPKFECPYDLSDKHETNVHNEFQGNFKTGILETSLLNRAYDRHCIDNYVAKFDMKVNLVVTHTDVVSGCFYIEVDNDLELCNSVIGADIANYLAGSLDYDIDRVFYNDSPESNIKEA